MGSNNTQRSLFPFARRPRQGTPSTVSSAEPPSSQPDSSSQISDESKDDSSNVELTQRSAAATPAESPTESSADSLQEEPTTPTPSAYRVRDMNLTLPARSNRQPISTESAPPSYIRPRMRRVADLATATEEHQAIQRPSQMLMDQMAVSYQTHPTRLTAEEEELMAPITMDELDKMFDDKDDSKSHQSQEMTSNPSVPPEASSSLVPPEASSSLAPLEASSSPAPKRARYTASSSPGISSARRTRSMTAALSASVSPAMNTRRLRSSNLASAARSASPNDLAEPESWASASVADKRLSHMKDAGKGWAEITATWNRETGKEKTSQEITKRWRRIEGKIGRWPGFDVALRGTTPDVSSGLSAELWQQIAAAVSTELGWRVSGEESAARFAALQEENEEAKKGKGKGKGKGRK